MARIKKEIEVIHTGYKIKPLAYEVRIFRRNIQKIILGFFFTRPFFLASPSLAIDMNTRTITQSVGKGINEGTNLTQNRDFRSTFASFTFPTTSEPFMVSPLVPSGLPTNFETTNSQLGAGIPCGPDDTNGPSFPYPCSSNFLMTIKIPGSMDSQAGFSGTCSCNVGIRFNTPSLGPSGAIFQTFMVSDAGGGKKNIRIEGGFDQILGDFSAPDSSTKFFYTLDSVLDANGQMDGNANGTFLMEFVETGLFINFNLPTTDPRASGTFTANTTGMLTCQDSASSPCLQNSTFP